MTSYKTCTLSEGQDEEDEEDENPYSVILETNTESLTEKDSTENDSPYATYTVIMSNPARNECSWFSWKRFCVGVLLCFAIATVVTISVLVTLYVKPESNTGNEGVISKLIMDESSPTTSSGTSGTRSSATPNATIHSSTWTTSPTTRSPTTSSAAKTATSPTTTTTKSALPPKMYNCSKPHRCHSCSSREVNGRCKANGRLVDTVQFGMSEECSVACYAEVRAPDQNYVHRGCVDSQGSKVEALVDPENLGCFPFEKWPGAGNSTYCFCCDDLCNTQDMTKYGGIDV